MFTKLMQLFKAKPIPEKITITATALSIAEFPVNLFSVYFEVFIEPRDIDYYAQVRFISRDTNEKVDQLEYTAVSPEILERMVADGVRDVMSKYTR